MRGVMRHVQIYRFVDAVARHGSIRRAAAAHSISPSALNRQILGLEEEIGAPLFERLSRGVRLSTAGEIYLRCFRAHIGELDRAASQVSDLSGVRAGVVRIGVGEELASTFLPSVVARHRSAFPNVDVQVHSVAFDDVVRALNEFDVDLVIAANPLIDATIETIHAEEAEVIGVAAGGEGADPATGAGARLSDLVDTPLIAPTTRSGLRNAVDAAFAVRSTPRRYAFVVDRLASEALREDPGALQVMLDLDANAAALAREGLRRVALAEGAISRPVVRVLRVRARHLPVAAAKFAEALTRRISDPDARI